MKDTRITVVHKHPGMEPKLVVVDNELHALQALVDGYIEIGAYLCHTASDALVVICNEEGKLRGLDINVLVDRGYGIDALVGPVFGAKLHDAEFADLTEDEAQLLISWMQENEVLT